LLDLWYKHNNKSQELAARCYKKVVLEDVPLLTVKGGEAGKLGKRLIVAGQTTEIATNCEPAKGQRRQQLWTRNPVSR